MTPSQRDLPPECRGIWYACGTANTLPGHGHVYSGPMATYCIWHRPMAVFIPEVQKTFFVYGNANNAPTISAYDHQKASFAYPVVLGSNRNDDAHRNPTLLVAEDGHLVVFYGAHGDTTHVLRSQKPYEIAAWEALGDLPDARTSYPQPWSLQPGVIFVSYRGASGWRFTRSHDGGRSWEAPTDLITFPEANIYAVTVAEEGPYPRKVHIAWSRLGGGTPEEIAKKHLWARRYNVYYAYSDDGGATWKRSDGTPYRLPITEESAEKLYDCGQHGVWLEDIQLDSQGNPYILFIDAVVETYESQWKLARHLGSGRWRITDVTTSDHMYDAGALVFLSDDDLRLYAPTTPSQPQEDGGEMEEWRSTDRGETWTNTRHLTRGSQWSHNHVKVAVGHRKGKGDLRMFWSYGDSNSPPATKEVILYCYGEATGEARPVGFPLRPEQP